MHYDDKGQHEAPVGACSVPYACRWGEQLKVTQGEKEMLGTSYTHGLHRTNSDAVEQVFAAKHSELSLPLSRGFVFTSQRRLKAMVFQFNDNGNA